MVPAGLEGIVPAVLGLDNPPQPSPHFRLSTQAAAPSSCTPPQVAQPYQFQETRRVRTGPARRCDP